MSARDDGGPAFPVIGAAGAGEDYGGASLRDYFAAHAPITRNDAFQRCLQIYPSGRFADEVLLAEFARLCFAYADTMIAERSK